MYVDTVVTIPEEVTSVSVTDLEVTQVFQIRML